MSILNQIVSDKLQEVEQLLPEIGQYPLEKTSKDTRIPLDFKKRLEGKPLSIIAEIKKASPSKGLIRADFDPAQIADDYQAAGTDCISILTEEKYFKGSPEFLRNIRSRVACPILRKDFMVDLRQVRESYEMGADAILLIVSVLTEAQLTQFKQTADRFGLTCLVEVHTLNELETALSLGFELIGINNRNLKTFETSINHSIELIRQIPDSVTTVSESGIKTADDCLKLQESGFNAVLVGETLMRQEHPGKALKELMSKVR